MVEVYKLMQRHLDGAKSGDAKLDQIKIFSTCIGHGVGTIDFSEKVLEIPECKSLEDNSSKSAWADYASSRRRYARR